MSTGERPRASVVRDVASKCGGTASRLRRAGPLRLEPPQRVQVIAGAVEVAEASGEVLMVVGPRDS